MGADGGGKGGEEQRRRAATLHEGTEAALPAGRVRRQRPELDVPEPARLARGARGKRLALGAARADGPRADAHERGGGVGIGASREPLRAGGGGGVAGIGG